MTSTGKQRANRAAKAAGGADGDAHSQPPPEARVTRRRSSPNNSVAHKITRWSAVAVAGLLGIGTVGKAVVQAWNKIDNATQASNDACGGRNNSITLDGGTIDAKRDAVNGSCLTVLSSHANLSAGRDVFHITSPGAPP